MWRSIPIFLSVPAIAIAEVPTISTQDFHGLQSGTERSITFKGKHLRDAQEIVFSREGITASDPVPGDKNKDQVTFEVSAANSPPPGEYPYRIRSKTGLSFLRILKVGTYPEFDESTTKLPLDDEASAITINGKLSREESDQFTVSLSKGQPLSIEVEGIRLGTHMFDPHISVLSASGKTLATADDSALLRQDPHLEFTAPEAGTYTIALRDSSYAADGNSPYRLHVGSFPLPAPAWPPGRQPGDTPLETNDGFAEVFTPKDGILPPNGNRIRLTPHEITEEKEPNNNFNQANASGATAFHGRFDRENDHDYYLFDAKKDTTYSVRGFANSLGSTADIILDVFSPEKKYIKGNDDSNGTLDPLFTFKAEADGTYYLRAREHLRSFGNEHFYRIELDKVVPSLALTIPQFDRGDTQVRQMLAVPRGGRVATLVNIKRIASKGAVTFEAFDLPEGVSLLAPELPANATQIPLVFEADSEAPLAGARVDLRASLSETPSVVTGFTQGLDLPKATNNRRPYRTLRQEKLPLAVVEPLPFSIEVEPLTVPLVQSGSDHLEIKITRSEGFEKPITLRLLGRPPGFGTSNTVTVPKDKVAASYPINANGKAAPGLWHLAIQAESGGSMTASELLPLTIEEDYVSITAPLAKTERGSTTELVCKATFDRKFEGEATAKLTGLPAHATAEPVTFTSGQETVTIPIVTSDKTPLGLSKNLRVTVEIPHPGGTIIQTAYQGGRLRIDPPKSPNLANQ